ncbi:unnamed protein product [Rhizophagus irregularis]|nr:unnamed protein product [Rhizophagus irregularis]
MKIGRSVTGQIHAKVINDYVVPTLHRHFPRGNGIFQEDNAAPHRSKMMVRHLSPPPSSISVLTEYYVKDAWDDILPEYYRKLINSMPRRIDAVISANGNRINY